MKPHTACALILATAGCLAASAQSSPDIIWSTNTHYNIQAVVLSGDGRFVGSCAGDQSVKVWSATNGSLARQFSVASGSAVSLALSSNGSFVYAGLGNGRSRMWRLSDGGIQWQNLPSGDPVFATAFSPNDVRCADGSGSSAVLRTAVNGVGAFFVYHEESTVNSVSFSPDGTLLATGGGDFVAKITRIADTNFLFTLAGHSGGLFTVDFSPDGTLLLTGSSDGTARLWNVTNGACVKVIEGAGGQAKFSATGKLFFSLNESVFKMWRVTSGECVGTILNTGAIKFDMAKNGKYFAYGTTSGDVVLARLPIVLDTITRTGNETILHWQGGSGLYQLQSNTNFATTNWQNLGPATTNSSATNTSASSQFFRVQSLPNP